MPWSGHRNQHDSTSRTTNLHQILCEVSPFLCGNCSDSSEGLSYGQLVTGSSLAHASHLMQSFFVKHQITQVTQPPTAHVWCPLTSKVKSPLKRERFQTADEIRENMMGQLRAIGRTV